MCFSNQRVVLHHQDANAASGWDHYLTDLVPNSVVGAFGAIAFTTGKYGLHTLKSLGKLIMIFYGTSAFFVIVILGVIAAACGINMLKLLRYLKDELLIVLGTSSSESFLPQLMRKLEHAGAPRQIVGLTVPTGYSFNLDGTCIYLMLAALARIAVTPRVPAR
nr:MULTISPECIES: cation:dicarboxylase symporter family transporter [unclassified Frankia]